MKRCSQCGRNLPQSEFHSNKKHDRIARGWRDDGLASWCKKCRSAWIAAHKDKIAHYNAEYYKRNREKRIHQVRVYQRQNPEVKRAVSNRRRARKRQGGGRHTTMDLRQIYEQQGGCCFYCKAGPMSRQEGQFDHVIPLARGGDDSAENIVFACEPCNRAKHARTLEEFLAWRLQQTNANRLGDAESSNATFGSSSDASETLR